MLLRVTLKPGASIIYGVWIALSSFSIELFSLRSFKFSTDESLSSFFLIEFGLSLFFLIFSMSP